MPWSGDGFGPLDFTLLDKHHGAIEDWRALITEIHRRDMYVIFENTMATLVTPSLCPPLAMTDDPQNGKSHGLRALCQRQRPIQLAGA